MDTRIVLAAGVVIGIYLLTQRQPARETFGVLDVPTFNPEGKTSPPRMTKTLNDNTLRKYMAGIYPELTGRLDKRDHRSLHNMSLRSGVSVPELIDHNRKCCQADLGPDCCAMLKANGITLY